MKELKKIHHKLGLFLLITLLFVTGIPSAAYAAKTVSVTVPTYPIKINQTSINNSKSQYPFIVYNDITYFPMTYNGCRSLGVEAQWKGNTEGLQVEKTGISAVYLTYPSTSTNKKTDQASVVTFPIKVNGKSLNNAQQSYPLLSYRNITYFPMTWDLAVNEFGWDFSFNAKDGLAIKSDNLQLAQKSLPQNSVQTTSTWEDEEMPSTLAITDKYIYCENTKGQILQILLSDTAKAKVVYQLPLWTYGQGQLVHASLHTEKNMVYLSYHQGGATMGADYLFLMNDDGTTTELQSSYHHIKIFGDKIVTSFDGPFNPSGNLDLQIGEAGSVEKLGDVDYRYVWNTANTVWDNIYLIGDNIYILAVKNNELGEKDWSKMGICKVNLSTKTTTRISAKDTTSFQLDGGYLYYHNDGCLYRIAVTDGREETVKQLIDPPGAIQQYAILGGNVYWQNESDQHLYDLNGSSLNPGAELIGMKISGDNDEYLICSFRETDLSKYRILVFDKAGNQVFKSSDTAQVNSINITGTTMVFFNNTSGTICAGKLS